MVRAYLDEHHASATRIVRAMEETQTELKRVLVLLTKQQQERRPQACKFCACPCHMHDQCAADGCGTGTGTGGSTFQNASRAHGWGSTSFGSDLELKVPRTSGEPELPDVSILSARLMSWGKTMIEEKDHSAAYFHRATTSKKKMVREIRRVAAVVSDRPDAA